MTELTDCARLEDDLKAYTDGELSWFRRLAIRRHLTRCASCREEIAIMSQITEDLRATEIETEDALDPSLRAKILEIAPPAPTTVDRGGAREEPAFSHPAPPELGDGGRKRPVPAWAIAGAALIAWFVFFPAFQKVRENARRPSATALAPPPSASPHLTVRLSNREAGKDSSGTYLQIKDPDSKFQDATGNENRVASSTNATGTLNGLNSDGTVTYGIASGTSRTTDVPALPSEPQRQVHKEASIGVQVPNPEATSDTVETMVKETGGYVASNNLSTGDDGLQSAELIVKVPVTEFETFLSQAAKLGKLQSKSLSGEDITEKTSDADQEEGVLEDDVQKSEARLKALGSRAKWHDEQATRDLRIQLAQSRARLVLLKRMAALATITVDLSQTPKAAVPAPVTGGFLSGLKATTHDALVSLINSAGALLALVIWLLAYAPVWIPLLLAGRYALREHRKRQAA